MKAYVPYIITNLAFALLVVLGAGFKITLFQVLLYGYCGFVLGMSLYMQRKRYETAVLVTFSNTWFRCIDLVYDYTAIATLFMLQEPIACLMYTLHTVFLQLAYYRAVTNFYKGKYENLH